MNHVNSLAALPLVAIAKLLALLLMSTMSSTYLRTSTNLARGTPKGFDEESMENIHSQEASSGSIRLH
eukprot:151048-Amphidinium_carterae.2